MKPKRQIEREFGVPIAGEILDPEHWTRTALKRLPAEIPLCWEILFGRKAPLVLDLGCGNGRFLIGSAVWRPDHDHLGIDILPVVLRYATRRANQRGLRNIRFAALDGLTLVAEYVAPGSVREVHCYHPQPYHDSRKIEQRLVTPPFLALVHRSLEPGGLFFIQTDNLPYWEYMQKILPVFFEFEEQTRPWPDAPKGRTRREILAMKRGFPIYRGLGRTRAGLTFETCCEIARSMPPPTFHAGPPLRELDEQELNL